MNGLRTGVSSIRVGREDESRSAPDPTEAGARAREDASVYAAWLAAGKTREQINAERRQRAAEAQERRGEGT